MWIALLALAIGTTDTTRLRVLSLNDFHGSLEPRTVAWSDGRPVGGLIALQRMMDSAARACACPVLRLDGGDEMQGTLLSNLVAGRSSVEGLNLLGLDAATVGNHDLDWGVDSLRSRQRDARYPWLAANVFDSVTGRRPDWARPWVILPVEGLRVAVIRFLTAETKSIVLADHVAGLTFRVGTAPLRDVLEDVRRAAPDFTILVAHAGAFCDSLACNGEIVDLARDLPVGAVDLIVSGHTHSVVNTVVNGIPIVQSASNGSRMGITDLWRVDTGRSHARVRVETVWADGPAGPGAAEAEALLAHYGAQAATLADRVIGTLDRPLRRQGDQYPLGNLIADAQRAAAEADVALMNNGGIRRDLERGPVTYGQLFELQPFQNQVVRIPLNGRILRAALERAVAGGRPDAHVSGVTVRWDPAKPSGQRIVSVTLADGRPLLDTGRYTLAVTNFMATGGGGYRMLAPLAWERTVGTDLDALVAWLGQRQGPISAPAEERFVPVPSGEARRR